MYAVVNIKTKCVCSGSNLIVPSKPSPTTSDFLENIWIQNGKQMCYIVNIVTAEELYFFISAWLYLRWWQSRHDIKREKEIWGGRELETVTLRVAEVTRGFPDEWSFGVSLSFEWQASIVIPMNWCTLVYIHAYHQTRDGLKRCPSATHKHAFPPQSRPSPSRRERLSRGGSAIVVATQCAGVW